MGITSMHGVAPIAYVSSWALVLLYLEKAMGEGWDLSELYLDVRDSGGRGPELTDSDVGQASVGDDGKGSGPYQGARLTDQASVGDEPLNANPRAKGEYAAGTILKPNHVRMEIVEALTEINSKGIGTTRLDMESVMRYPNPQKTLSRALDQINVTKYTEQADALRTIEDP